MTEIHAFDPDGTPSPGALAALAAVTDGLVSEEQLAAATEGLPLEIVWDGSVLFVNGQASPDLKGTSGIASITSPRSGVWMIDQATDQDTETLSTLQQEVADKATRGELEALQGVIDSKLGPADKQNLISLLEGKADLEALSDLVDKIEAVPRVSSGIVTITPTATNAVTSAEVTFPRPFDAPPNVVATAWSSVPNQVVQVTVSNVTATGCTVYMHRTTSTATNVMWIAASE